MAFLNTCVIKVVIIFATVFSSPWFVAGEETPILKDGDVIEISLLNYTLTDTSGFPIEKLVRVQPSSTITLNVLDIPRSINFVMIQTHSYQYNTTLSYNEILKPHFHVNGTNIGLVEYAVSTKMQFFIINSNSIVDTLVLASIQAYNKNAPIPGGCNMEFSVEIAPYLSLHYSKSLVIMETQPAALPSNKSACDVYPSQVKLDVYHMYLPERDFSSETYFDAIRKMMTVQGIQEHGSKVPEPHQGSAMRRVYSSYPGTGSVYAVIATAGRTASAAYVPSVTYSCGGKSWADEDTCEVLTAPFSKVLCAMVFFFGLLMCFCGHKFFKTETFLLGFLTAAIITYIVVAMYNPGFNELTLDLYAFFSGMGCGLLWLCVWVFCGIPVLSVLLATLALGYVLASVVMFAGLGDVYLLQWDVNFWAAFTCLMCSVALVTFPMMHKANMIACAILGAFAVVTPIDHYIGSNLKYIVVNTLRRATVTDFKYAIVDPPFQLQDCLLSVLWICLSGIGAMIQFCLQRGKPPFPPPTVHWFAMLCCSRRQRYTTTRRQEVAIRREVATERTPLMVEAHIPYGGVSDNVFDSPTDYSGAPDSRAAKLLDYLLRSPHHDQDSDHVIK